MEIWGAAEQQGVLIRFGEEKNPEISGSIFEWKGVSISRYTDTLGYIKTKRSAG